jgi:hypothetical protein
MRYLVAWVVFTLGGAVVLYLFVALCMALWFLVVFVQAPFDHGMALFKFCREIDTIATGNALVTMSVSLIVSGIFSIYYLANSWKVQNGS